jgi:hypothetical protein
MSEEFMGSTGTQTASTEQVQATEVKAETKSEYTDFLEAITNQEGKPKYKTVADALIGAAKAQEHIQRIEQENASLREVAQKVSTMEQVLLNLDKQKGADQLHMPGIEDQEKLIVSVLEKQKMAEKALANKQFVLENIQKRFGDKSEEVLKQKANDLGLSVSELGALASRSPQAVLEFFKTEQKGTPTVTGTVNTQALQPNYEQKTPENILWGASNKEVIDFWKQIKTDVTRDLGL